MTIQRQRYAIEICIGERERGGQRLMGACGGSLYFQPSGRKLRSRWTPAEFATFDCNENMKALMLKVGKIPGEIVWCDLTKGNSCDWGTIDPLNNHKPGSQEEKTATKLKEVMQSHFGHNSGTKFRNPVTLKLATADDEKNVLYWMARALKSGVAVEVDGSPKLPTMEEIKKMPGRRSVHFGAGSADPETKEILSRYDDFVSVATGKS